MIMPLPLVGMLSPPEAAGALGAAVDQVDSDGHHKVTKRLLRSIQCKGRAPAITRDDFPQDFIFGVSSSCYQTEGAIAEGGKGLNIWDVFTHERPELIKDRSNGDVAVDSFHRYEEDTSFVEDAGMDAYRFSISWTRILPKGNLSGGLNKDGIQYYNRLINALVEKGLKPFVTLFHWDLPYELESTYQGFLSQRFVDDYRDFVNVCFKEFGDRVKNWITFNEPSMFCKYGYSLGILPPARGSPWQEGNCKVGDSATEPYIVAHHLLLAHAAAVLLYRMKFQDCQKGKIGITLCCYWFEPYTEDKANRDAVSRTLDFSLGWFLDPITQGDYPFIMKAIVGNRLPRFTRTQSDLLKGSFDFIGLNYYTASYIQSLSYVKPVQGYSYEADMYILQTGQRNGIPIGEPAGSPWLMSYPEGLKKMLLYIKEEYNNPPIFITENGTNELNKEHCSLEEALNDDNRISFHEKHLLSLHEAINKGANVKGYFMWSLMDSFEFASGYTVRFGLVYVDFDNNLQRYPKSSFNWFRAFLKPLIVKNDVMTSKRKEINYRMSHTQESKT